MIWKWNNGKSGRTLSTIVELFWHGERESRENMCTYTEADWYERRARYVVQLMGRTIRRLADQMDGDILATRTDATKRFDHRNKNSTAQIKALRKEGCYTVEEQWNVLSMRSCNEGE
jgi:DNA anti-recombination protein RmuC